MTKYRALVDVQYPTDPSVIRRLLAGEDLPEHERGPIRSVLAGEIAGDFPTCSVAGFLAKGKIELVPDESPPPRAVRFSRSEPEEVPA